MNRPTNIHPLENKAHEVVSWTLLAGLLFLRLPLSTGAAYFPQLVWLDPLYEILGDNFCVFEWTTPTGSRRKYKEPIYSKNYFPLHIPIVSKVFLDLALFKLLKRKKFSIESEEVLQDVLVFFTESMQIDNEKLTESIYDAIAVFSYLKEFFVDLLRTIEPKAVLIRCGYGRFHMALSQACRKLDIPAIELQHGIITKYHVGYVKSAESENRDCIPRYLLTYGAYFSDIVRKGHLFKPENVITAGFPYIEEVKEAPSLIDNRLKKFLSNFSITILVTSQWTVADETKKNFIKLSKELEEGNIGIVFKPHPRDWREYPDLNNYDNIYLADKYDDVYELLKVVDIHSTPGSTSAMEALAFGKPNIFVQFREGRLKDSYPFVDDKSSFIVTSQEKFVEKLNFLITNYEYASKVALKKSEVFFRPNAKRNIENFLSLLGLINYKKEIYELV